MKLHFDIDIDDIDIASWRYFKDNNAEILRRLDYCCSNVADLIANVSTISASIPNINSALAGLKTVKNRSLIPNIPELDQMTDCINNIDEYLKDKSLIIVSGIRYAELSIDEFGNPTTVDGDVKDIFQQIFRGAADANLYWIVYEFTKTMSTPLQATGFLLAYGTDWAYEGQSFVIGDAAAKAFDIAEDFLLNQLEKEIPFWINSTSFGTAVVVVWTAFSEIREHNKTGEEWTPEEKKLLLAETVESGLTYLEWILVAEAVGGVPGAVVAALVAIPTSMIFDYINDYITGDDVIYTYERDGQEYSITSNGKGAYGDFEAIINNYSNYTQDYYIGDRLCSEHEYKERMYTDLTSFLSEDTGIDFREDNVYEQDISYSEYYISEKFQEAILKMKECETYEDAEDVFYETMFPESGPSSEQENIDQQKLGKLQQILREEYGFDLEECYYILTMNGGK